MKKIKIFGKEVIMTKKDLEDFRRFHKNHIKDVKCYLAYQNNELCFHEKCWLLKRFLNWDLVIENV